LSRTPASASNQQKWTWSGWVKRGQLGVLKQLFSAGSGTTTFQMYFNGSGGGASSTDGIELYANNSGTQVLYYTSTAVRRDPASWYHIVLAVDTTQATAGNRVLLYVNGASVTDITGVTVPAQNTNLAVNSTAAHYIGQFNSSNYFDGYLTEVNFIDGQALTPSSFGSTNALTGVWQPAAYTGSYGTNGFYLPFNLSTTATYSATVNGTSQYLTAPSNSAFNFTGDFCVEAFALTNVDPSTAPGYYPRLVSLGDYNSAGNFGIELNDSAGSGARGLYPCVRLDTSVTVIPAGQISSVALKLNQWNHIAVCRSGSGTNNCALFINGVRTANFTNTSSTSYSGTFQIGALLGGNFWSGQISNVRVVKGSSVYTPSLSTITVPSSPLTAITNTQLLTLQNATIIDNSTNAFTITNFNSVTTSIQYPFNTGSSVANDQSGNGNNWSTNNISLNAGVTYDSMTDVPTLTSATAANFCVLNPLSNSTNTLSNANISIASAVGNANTRCNSTIAVSSGKWYYEITLTGVGTNSAAGIGQNQITNAYPANDALSYAYELDNARIGNNNSFSAYGSALVLNDIFMCAFDLDNNKIFFGKNGTWFNSSDPAAGTSPAYTLTAGTYCPIARPYNANLVGASFANNFGQRPFTYTAPSGFVALNTYNLPDSTIVKGNTVMDATLYTGNATGQSVTNTAAFKPDLVWLKQRSAGVTFNLLYDSIRGATKYLSSNSTVAEGTIASSLTAFNSNGFTVGTDPSGLDNGWNGLAATYVGWQWQAGQGTSSSNTNGTITSTVSVNASAGFSVVTYTGTGANVTVGHGLGVAPSFIIFKRRDSTSNWPSYHQSLGNTGGVYLNGTNAFTTGVAFWNNTSPTSTVFTIGGANEVNVSTATNVAYCWTPIAGFSAFGGYTGNGSTNGAFIYTGFRPRFVLVKQTDAVGNWIIWDTARSTYNQMQDYLVPNSSGAESNNVLVSIDALSNGFKCRTSDDDINGSGNTYIYMAFAENPFKNALAR
jgi:hypothetical protein